LLNRKLYHKKYTKNIKTFDNVAFMVEKQIIAFIAFSRLKGTVL